MPQTNKEILEQANAAITQGDFEGFLALCTEDTVWTFEGDRTLHAYCDVWRFREGKMAELRAFVVETGSERS